MHWFKLIRRSLPLLLLILLATHEQAQNTISAPPHRDTLLLPEANRPPDKNDQIRMNQQKQGKHNFDAANALRRKQIDEDSVKLLILANDLKTKVDALGDGPIPAQLLREATVIELLARNVQSRMALTVGSN
jgi:hypothetical protein